MLRRYPAWRRHRRERLDAPAALHHQQPGAKISQWPSPIGVANDARQSFDISRKAIRSIRYLCQIHPQLGIVAAQGDAGVNALRAIVADDRDERLPIDARASVIVLAAQLEALATLIGSIEKRIKMQHRSNETSQRVETIPGIGVLGATAIVATAVDPTVFRSGRDFAAWIGLVPRQDSTGGKQKLGPISKQGDSPRSRACRSDHENEFAQKTLRCGAR
jgi:hypothetical protein